jgi:hypothetical protein
LIEPHTGTETAIGTLEVRAYLNGRGAAQRSTSIRLREEERFPTHGPENRYKPAGLREPVAKELERGPTWSWESRGL